MQVHAYERANIGSAYSCLYTPVAKDVMLVVATVALAFFSSPLFPLVASMALFSLAAGLVVKIADGYNSSSLKALQIEVYRCIHSIPYLQAVAFIFSLAISSIYPSVGIALGSTMGCINGLTVGMRHSRRLQ